jgi:predicted regulator of Ras-like GTPase activity (Roadblock/LC7/MglB family)
LSFQAILRRFLQSTPRAIGAIFIDHEGESVDFWTERVFDIGADGLRVIGAYQSMYIAQIDRICKKIEAGQPRRLVLDFEHARVITWHLKENYYLVVVAEQDSHEEILLKRLSACRDRLLKEL